VGDFDARLLEVSGTLQTYSATATNHFVTLLQDGVLFGYRSLLQIVQNHGSDWKGETVFGCTGVCAYQGTGPSLPNPTNPPEVGRRSRLPVAPAPVLRE